MARERFEHDLQEVQTQLHEICTLAIQALDKSINALLNHDLDTALLIMDQDRIINRIEENINDQVILLIAKQQPVATDLRRLIVMIKIASDMERIGDYAVNIAKETIRIGKADIVYPMDNIVEMRDCTIMMLNQVVKAFVDEDIKKAKEIAEIDDRVDELYGATIVELLSQGAKNPKNLSQITQLSFVCRYLERSADHATNLAEQLFYLVKGRHYELNN